MTYKILYIFSLLFFLLVSCELPSAATQKTSTAAEPVEKVPEEKKLKEGYHEEFWPNGKLSAAGYYKNGKANGPMKWYHEKGFLGAYGDMVDGKRNGPWVICDLEDGTTCIHANFNMEVREGIWKVFHDNGQLQRSQKWVDDKMIAEQCWDEKGSAIDCE